MRFVHRIGFRPTPGQRRELELLGVDVPTGAVLPGDTAPALVAFDVAEDHPNWPALRDLFRRWDVSDTQKTEFSQEEFDNAEWLELGAWHHGYPQPHLDFGFRAATYDLTDWCDQCGIGLKQRAPFQMKGEPKWGGNGILQLNWVFDEIFVKPEVWSQAFRPHHIGSRPVMSANGSELKTIVQLVIEEEITVATEGLPHQRCPRCGRVKYLPVTRGPFPAPMTNPSHAIAKTRAYFGSGAEAHRHVLVSREVAHSLAEARVRGAVLRPGQPLAM